MLGLKQHVRLQIDAEYVGLVVIRIEIERRRRKKKPKKEEDRNFQNFPVENAR